MSRSSERLCLCEYINQFGRKSHVLTCCCDCQAFDEIGERVLTCRQIDPSLCQSFRSTVSDRCRFPFPGGARKMDLKLLSAFVAPLIVVLLSTVNVVANASSIMMLAFFIRYLSRTQSASNLVFALSYIIVMVVVFATEIDPYYEVLYRERVLVYSLLTASLLLLALGKITSPKKETHHYVFWLDCYLNHVNFKFALGGSCLLIVLGFYLSHLVTELICHTEEIVTSLPFLRFPTSCPEIYSDFHHSLNFMCTLYSVIGTLLLVASTLRLLVRYNASGTRHVLSTTV